MSKRFLYTQANLNTIKLKLPLSSTTTNTNANTNTETPDCSLTAEEIIAIKEHPFLSRINVGKSLLGVTQPIKSAADYIPMKDGYLSFKLPSGVPSPFEMYKKFDRPSESRISIETLPRLSVTKLLTKSWCELRQFYEVYSRKERVTTKAMQRGKEIHADLETETHPIIDTSNTIDAIPIKPTTQVDKIADNLLISISRISQLLLNYEARELYVHGFANTENGIVGDPRGSNLLITGIIDYLYLRCKDQNFPLQRELQQYSNDFSQFIDVVPSIVDKYKDSYNLVVCDVKTRRIKRKPNQESVVESSKDQVILYEKLLHELGKDQEQSFNFLKEYHERLGINIDESITPEFALIWFDTQPFFYEDFLKISRGEPLNVKQFDEIDYSYKFQGGEVYDLSHLTDEIEDSQILQNLSPFLTSWEKPLTLRYFITRLSQLLPQVTKLLKGDLRVQYYCEDTMFEELKFDYDEKRAKEIVTHGLKFWFGLKDPEPIEPSFKNFNEKCRLCDFKDNCSWKHKFDKNED